ncbi:bifunctional diguanylate cyclase/phosphodiesterase [Shewanella gaetbuli]|uniref:EAL domain-containing protein n=1 Tax=Shewanella gaetbuli TaxID=220752 RepID=A0A9X2CLG3_9GAMM|nr:EAL domain-containing protein [Shewanella gaetbuli]MCL1144121.1 EAL domain-containing protein [Shewanella gaetbuli]
MTLFRQIYALLFVLFLLIVASIAYVQFTETQSFLSKQMESDINNASHSLGLMLVPALEAGDDVATETLVNVLFEGGYYQQITLTWLVDGKQQVWTNDIRVTGVPQWFIDLNLFKPITKENVITSGWLQLAKLEITAHPGFGYHEMWRIISNIIIVFSILFLIAILFARVGLGMILKPLNSLSEHAQKIAKRQFGPDMPTPKTTELKELVRAFNSMSAQLKQVFSSLDEEVSALRKKNLVDHVSNLPNRQYMVSRINGWLSEPSSGALMLIKMDWLEDVHSQYGYQIRDETIKLLAEQLHQQLDEISPSVIARIAAYEFAVLIEESERDLLTRYLQCLIRTTNKEISKAGCKPNERFNIGIAERLGQMTVTDILAQADNALQRSRQDNKVFHWFENSQQQLFSREDWRVKLTEAINDKQFQFRWQPVMQLENTEVSQRELFCQLSIQDNMLHAGQFMPFVEMLSLGAMLDRCLIETVAKHNLFERNLEPIAINLTFQSISDQDFHVWLKQFLQNHSTPERVCFEIPEASVYSDLLSCEKICHIIRECGAKFGIDHFGRQFGSMTYLQNLRPSYVKLDQSFAFIEENQHNSELCRALVNVAKGLDIEVIVTGIQEQEQLARFSELRLDAYQGFIAPPEEIKLG